MKHVFDCKELHSNVVLIFGKGPSFYDRAWGIVPTAKVYCINQSAIPVLKAGRNPDLVVCNDVEPINDLAYWVGADQGFRRLAFPFYVHYNEQPSTIPSVGEHSAIMATDKSVSSVLRYDLHTASHKFFENHPVIQGPTTYCAALTIAAHHGARFIYTNGIDGGKKRHANFENTHQVNPPNYDAQFEFEKQVAAEYGITIRRV